jgi:hypothetical protein
MLLLSNVLYFTDNGKSLKQDSFFRELLGSDHSQEKATAMPASLLYQFIVVMVLETTNEEQAHLRRKVRGEKRTMKQNTEREKNNKSINGYGNKWKRMKK